MNDGSNWIRRTGQAWKVLVLFLWLFTAFGMLMADQLTGSRHHLLALTVPLFVVWIVWLLFAISCPACRRRPFYRLMRTMGQQHWPAVYWTIQRCPDCGSDGNSTAGARPKA